MLALMTRRFVVALLPHWEDVETVRRSIDPSARRLPAHLTLVHPFESDLPDRVLWPHLEAACEATAPFSVWLDGVSGHGDQVFWNVKRGNDACVALRDRLYEGAFAPFRSLLHTFTPHVTLGSVPDEGRRARVIGELAGKLKARALEVHTLTVYRSDEDAPPEIEAQLAVGGAF